MIEKVYKTFFYKVYTILFPVKLCYLTEGFT